MLSFYGYTLRGRIPLNINYLYESVNSQLTKLDKPTIDKERFLVTLTKLQILGDIEIDNEEVKTTRKTN